MVTVDEAIKKGHRMITIPGYIIMLTLLVSFIFLDLINMISNLQMLVGIGVSIIIPWLYQSIMITKWRIWAFKYVDNHHALKLKAIREKLIWKDGSIFEKTEIRNKKEKAELKSILSQKKR